MCIKNPKIFALKTRKLRPNPIPFLHLINFSTDYKKDKNDIGLALKARCLFS
jgi:hypothetical protein